MNCVPQHLGRSSESRKKASIVTRVQNPQNARNSKGGRASSFGRVPDFPGVEGLNALKLVIVVIGFAGMGAATPFRLSLLLFFAEGSNQTRQRTIILQQRIKPRGRTAT